MVDVTILPSQKRANVRALPMATRKPRREAEPQRQREIRLAYERGCGVRHRAFFTGILLGASITGFVAWWVAL